MIGEYKAIPVVKWLRERRSAKTIQEQELMGYFDARKDYFTHTEWVKAGTGFGFLLGVFISVVIWFLIKV